MDPHDAQGKPMPGLPSGKGVFLCEIVAKETISVRKPLDKLDGEIGSFEVRPSKTKIGGTEAWNVNTISALPRSRPQPRAKRGLYVKQGAN